MNWHCYGGTPSGTKGVAGGERATHQAHRAALGVNF